MDKATAEIVGVIARAVQNARIDHPTKSDGTQWDQVYTSNEESELFAGAVMVALKEAGYRIVRRDS